MYKINDWIQFYQSGWSANQIAIHSNVSPSTVLKHLRKHQVLIRNRSESHRKYKLNEYYFKNIDTKEKAYWLGMLYADGCIYRDQTSYKISLTLHQQDREHLARFQSALTTEKPIANSNDGVARLVLSSKILFDDLYKKGVFERKSLILQFPSKDIVSEKHEKSFLLGYFDGDGSISIDKNGEASFSVLGTFHFLFQMQRILIQHLHLSATKIEKNGNIYQLQYHGNQQVEKIMAWFYRNQSLYLLRKYLVYQKLKEKNKSTQKNTRPLKTKVQKKITSPMQLKEKRRMERTDYYISYIPQHPFATTNGCVLTHRFLMEKRLGRFLQKNEYVVCQTSDKKNLSSKNWFLSTSEHFHHRKKGITFIGLRCPHCGTTFEKEKRKLRKVKYGYFCSLSCAAHFQQLIKNEGWNESRKRAIKNNIISSEIKTSAYG